MDFYIFINLKGDRHFIMCAEKNKTYRAIDVANYIVDSCDKDGHKINNLKLQYILFLLQKIYLKETDCPLFFDDICAWPFGPCVPNVYYEFCAFAGQGIRLFTPPKTEIKADDRIIIDDLLNYKRTLSWQETQLYREVCIKYGAWDQIYSEKGNRSIIPLNIIKQEPYMIGEEERIKSQFEETFYEYVVE